MKREAISSSFRHALGPSLLQQVMDMKYSRFYTVLAMGLAITLSFSSAACSLAFAKKPPQNHEMLNSFECTDSSTLPTLDTLLALFEVLHVAVAVTLMEESDEEKGPYSYYGAFAPSRPRNIAMGVTVGTLGILSAIYGNHVVDTCRRAKRDADRRRNESIGWMPVQMQRRR